MLQENITRDLCEQHAEDASFLWLLRDQAVYSPNYTAYELAALDERIEAHLDGLRIGEDIGWAACKENLAWKDPGEVFTGTAVAFNTGKKQNIDAVLDVGAQNLILSRGVISGVAWNYNKNMSPFVKSFIQSEEAIVRRIGVGVCGVLRSDMGTVLDQLINDKDAIVSTRALKAAGESGRVDTLSTCLQHLNHDDEDCRYWAAWSAALLGDKQASIETLKELALQGGERAEQACDLVGRYMDLNLAQSWLHGLGQKQENHRLSVIFASAIGMPVLVSWLINMMTIPDLARKAGEAFTNITGADLVDFHLAGDEPEGFEAGPTENPADEMVAMDPDEDLPWPDINLVSQWWAQNNHHFDPHQRYLLGYPINPESLKKILSVAKQSNRQAAALELALQTPDEALVEVRARISPF